MRLWVWLESVGVLCQALEAGKNLVGKYEYESWNRVTATYNAFPSHALQVAFANVVALSTLKKAYPWPLIGPVRNGFISFTNARQYIR